MIAESTLCKRWIPNADLMRMLIDGETVFHVGPQHCAAPLPSVSLCVHRICAWQCVCGLIARDCRSVTGCKNDVVSSATASIPLLLRRKFDSFALECGTQTWRINNWIMYYEEKLWNTGKLIKDLDNNRLIDRMVKRGGCFLHFIFLAAGKLDLQPGW